MGPHSFPSSGESPKFSNNNGIPNPTFVPGVVVDGVPISDGTVRMKRQISLLGGVSVSFNEYLLNDVF